MAKEQFLMYNIPMRAKCSTGLMTGNVSISINKMLLTFNDGELEKITEDIVNYEIRTPDNTTYFKDLVVEVLQEQGLI